MQSQQKRRGTMDDDSKYVWTYDEKKKIILNRESLPALSFMNARDIDLDAVVFPDNLELILKIKKPIEEETTDEPTEQIDFSGRFSKMVEESSGKSEQQSIIIQKLREHVIRFERLLAKYLDPDLPTGRRNRKKFLEERKLFAEENYKQIIMAIRLKVEALCKFEHIFNRKMFDGEEKDYLNTKIDEAMKGNFQSAQDVVNSVMQIVVEDEFAVPKRRYVRKLA